MIQIIPYSDKYKNYIKDLNVEWLEKYFSVEPHDQIQLADPDKEIRQKGGQIYYATYNGNIVGTVTLMRVDEITLELGKMAVNENFQGLGIGKKLLEFAIESARLQKINSLILYSNTVLQQAIGLYRKYGFVEVEMDRTHYKRANIKMELKL